jgi:hypothetical protein
MRPAGTRLAEVVDVLHLADDGEDDVSRRLSAGGCDGSSGDEADSCGEEEDPSGCRPVAAHRLRFQPGARAKLVRLRSEVADVSRLRGARRGAGNPQ